MFLEAGGVPGPRWLDALLVALEADPANGIAGPTTNSAWNQQCAMRAAGSSLAEVAATAQETARRFGTVWRSLGSPEFGRF